MPLLLAFALLFVPETVKAGAAFAGMGGVGVGIADSSGNLADNAAALSDVSHAEGVVHLGGSFRQVTYAGSMFNRHVTTVARLPLAEGLGWTLVTPRVAGGRLGLGAWQMERHALELREPLDLGLSHVPGYPPLSARYYEGSSYLKQDEMLNAFGVVWIQPVGGHDQQVSLGVAYLDLVGEGLVEADAEVRGIGSTEMLRRLAQRRSLRGFALFAGYFYRPVETGSLGASLEYSGRLKGDIWEQHEGGPLYRDEISRPGRLKFGVGGAFTLFSSLTAAVDVRYAGESDREGKWLFSSAPARRYATEFSDSTVALRAGLEYRLGFEDFDLPLRIGFYNEPDPAPVRAAGTGASAVTDFFPASFKQDVSAFTFGGGWEQGALRADLAILWMSVNTYVRREVTGSEVSSGDVRDSLGVVGSVSLRFGGE